MGEPGTWQVVVMHGGRSWTVPLEAGEYRIGRAEGCEIRIEEGRVSRLHAVLTAPGGQARPRIGDRDSENGTRVVALIEAEGGASRASERRLEAGEEVEIAPGTLVHIGSAVLMLTEAVPVTAGDGGPELVVCDPGMARLHDLIRQVAPSELPVLLQGESGVGKESLARRLHAGSPRQAGRFVGIKCGSLEEPLLEAELFGQARRGPRSPGLLELAAGGTLFLDEVAALAPGTQARLARALDERQFAPLGGGAPRRVDARLVAATDRDLEQEITAGRFRRDLRDLLGGLSLSVPPLRERLAELEPLARHFLEVAAGRARRATPRIGPGARDAILRYPWPGNVRELCTVIERAMILCEGDELQAEHLGLRLSGALPLPVPARAPTIPDE